MIRLMCSKNRQEVETLESELFRAGVPSEIRSNPLADALGITRLEIYVDERDLPIASKVHHALEALGSDGNPPNGLGGSRGRNGVIGPGQAGLVLEAETVASAAPKPPRKGSPGRKSESDGDEFAQITALLEKEVEELLARESKLVNRCALLEDKVKSLDDSLAQARSDLAREVSKRSDVEKKLAEVGEARANLEKEMRALETRFQSTAQALTAAQARLESQARELSAHQARIADFKKEVASRDAQLEKMAESLAQARAGMEEEKDLRRAAEQKSGELAAARKSLERQLAQQAQQQEQLLRERQDEQEQMRTYLNSLNDLRGRLKARMSAQEKH